jgi:putative lipoic acid-binding regulatory protein
MDRQEARRLLEETHAFPGRFNFRVVVRPADREAVVQAIEHAGGEHLELLGVEARESRQGTYISLHVHATVSSPDTVLAVWSALSGRPEVVYTM